MINATRVYSIFLSTLIHLVIIFMFFIKFNNAISGKTIQNKEQILRIDFVAVGSEGKAGNGLISGKTSYVKDTFNNNNIEHLKKNTFPDHTNNAVDNKNSSVTRSNKNKAVSIYNIVETEQSKILRPNNISRQKDVFDLPDINHLLSNDTNTYYDNMIQLENNKSQDRLNSNYFEGSGNKKKININRSTISETAVCNSDSEHYVHDNYDGGKVGKTQGSSKGNLGGNGLGYQGNGNGKEGDFQCPQDMVYIPGTHKYCIDRFEFPNKSGIIPKSVSQLKEAISYCEDAGKRLCDKDEWISACIGISRKQYSYSDKYIENKCNVSSESISSSRNYYGCVSDFHVYDMIGNLPEWVINTELNKGEMLGGKYDSDKSISCYTSENTVSNIPITSGFRCCL